MTLLKRIIVEKRVIVVPLLLAIVVNVGVYALVVYPLIARAANAVDRAAAAADALKAAERDQKSARDLVTGKAKADQELTTFYQQVLPGSYSAARRMLAGIPALAKKTNVKLDTSHTEVDTAIKDTQFGRLKTKMVLLGEYEAIRQFVYDLETSSDFVIIDGMSLAQAEANKPLALTLDLSTYYRLGADGT